MTTRITPLLFVCFGLLPGAALAAEIPAKPSVETQTIVSLLEQKGLKVLDLRRKDGRFYAFVSGGGRQGLVALGAAGEITASHTLATGEKTASATPGAGLGADFGEALSEDQYMSFEPVDLGRDDEEQVDPSDSEDATADDGNRDDEGVNDPFAHDGVPDPSTIDGGPKTYFDETLGPQDPLDENVPDLLDDPTPAK